MIDWTRGMVPQGNCITRMTPTPKCDAALGYHEAVLARSKRNE